MRFYLYMAFIRDFGNLLLDLHRLDKFEDIVEISVDSRNGHYRSSNNSERELHFLVYR